jgi:hypothetical protein
MCNALPKMTAMINSNNITTGERTSFDISIDCNYTQ